MRIYVASKFENQIMVKEMMISLENRGHTITQDWTCGEGSKPSDEITKDEWSGYAALDVVGVQMADLLIVIPRYGCKGTWVEMGIAIAHGIPILVLTRDGERFGCIFERLAGVKHSKIQWWEKAVASFA